MSVMVGIGRGAQAGVLIRNAEAIEVMEKVGTIVVDKTGTLTEGKPRLTQVLPANGVAENELLLAAASVEQSSEHPLAAAIVQGAKDRGVKPQSVDEFSSVTGDNERTANAVAKKLGLDQVAAGLFYPFFGLLLSPIPAGAAMSFSSLSVIANALRLRRTRLS